MRRRDSQSIVCCEEWTDALRLRRGAQSPQGVSDIDGVPKDVKPEVLLIQPSAALTVSVDLAIANPCSVSGSGLSRASKG